MLSDPILGLKRVAVALHHNIAVLVAVMLHASVVFFLSDRRFYRHFCSHFFEISASDLGVATMPTLVFC